MRKIFYTSWKYKTAFHVYLLQHTWYHHHDQKATSVIWRQAPFLNWRDQFRQVCILVPKRHFRNCGLTFKGDRLQCSLVTPMSFLGSRPAASASAGSLLEMQSHSRTQDLSTYWQYRQFTRSQVIHNHIKIHTQLWWPLKLLGEAKRKNWKRKKNSENSKTGISPVFS